jgi:hypothetical protein
MSLPEVPPLANIAPPEGLIYDLAVIIDNTVYQIIGTDGQSAAQFLSQPTFVQVDKTQVEPGYLYNPETQEFIKPSIVS